MSKKKVTAGSMARQYQANCDRIQEIADACEAEQRERTDAEDAEYVRLCRENKILEMRMNTVRTPEVPERKSPDAYVREAVESGRQGRITLALRDVEHIVTGDVEDTGIIPVRQETMLDPIRTGLIYGQLGLTIRAGIKPGQTVRWPRHTKATAYVLDEGKRVDDTKINFDALVFNPRRIATATPVTKEALEGSDGQIMSVVSTELPASVSDLLNEAMFATSDTVSVSGGGSAPRKLYGPLVEAAKKPAVTFAGAVPTRGELLKMRVAVSKAVGKIYAGAWVMTEDMKAELENVKVDEGSGRFLCEGNSILGYPVYTTADIEGIAFGDWSYEVLGLGELNVILDPYTLARENATDCVLNTGAYMGCLLQDAFAYGKIKETAKA